MARTYKRDSNGRFSSAGGARSGRPAAKPVSRGKNRITRDNAGRIASVGGEGATARGGRLRTAAGNKRARVLTKGPKRNTPVGAIRSSDVAMARMLNATSKNIEQRNKAGINPPWTPAENSGTRLRRAKQRIAERNGAKPAQAGPASAAQLKRASLRAERLSGRAQKVRQVIEAATGGPVFANSQYSATKKAGKNMSKRDLSEMTKQMKTYQRAMKSERVARRALSLYATAKPARRRKPR